MAVFGQSSLTEKVLPIWAYIRQGRGAQVLGAAKKAAQMGNQLVKSFSQTACKTINRRQSQTSGLYHRHYQAQVSALLLLLLCLPLCLSSGDC